MRCRGVQGVAITAFLGGFLCSGLLRVTPYCAPGGVRVVSISPLLSGSGTERCATRHTTRRRQHSTITPRAPSLIRPNTHLSEARQSGSRGSFVRASRPLPWSERIVQFEPGDRCSVAAQSV